MVCVKPIFNGDTQSTIPCGQCMACRINNKRKWTARILLEHSVSESSIFITLTYMEAHLPRHNDSGLPTLLPRDVTLWHKRLRKRIGSFRYFTVGEYGEKTFRPHYHSIIFGMDTNIENDILETWGKGLIQVSPFSAQRAAYIAHYTTKKITREDSIAQSIYAGRRPEFVRSSRRPGIGLTAIPHLIRQLETKSAKASIRKLGDIPSTFRIEGATYPLDRYLRNKIRDHFKIGHTKKDRNEFYESIDLGQMKKSSIQIDRLRRAPKHGTL